MKEINTVIGDSFIEPALVLIKAGEFVMGTRDDEKVGYDVEKPAHEVKIKKDFYMAKFLVTFNEYDKFCKDTNRELVDDNGWGRDSRPVMSISWNDAIAYAKWLSEKTGSTYRLSTEEEWEYSCRAGSVTPYGFGTIKTGFIDRIFKKKYAELDDYGWYMQNSDEQTHPVGTKKPNAWGLYDMAGNLYEWCNDDFTPYENADNEDDDGMDESIFGDSEDSLKVLRGGSWYGVAQYLRSNNRYFASPVFKGDIVGFRVVKES